MNLHKFMIHKVIMYICVIYEGLKTVLNIIFFTVLLLTLSANAQKYCLVISADSSDTKLIDKYLSKNNFADTLQLRSELNDAITALRNDGYIAVSVDSLLKKNDTLTAIINLGDKYKWIRLGRGNVSPEILQEAGYKEKNFLSDPFRYKKFSALCEKIIGVCENNGYPFASLRLDSVRILQDGISASLKLNKYNKIEIDSVVMRGKAKLSLNYLCRYIDVYPGELYDESKVSKISDKMKELQFIKEIKPMNIIFSESKAKIVIYADRKKNSYFDGLLGVLPNNNTTGKLLITGEANLALVNAFAHGESFDLNWRKLQKNTQDLKISFFYPYLLTTPFGLDLKFTLYKNDTLYINLLKNLGVRYMFTGTDYLKAFFENQTSSLLSPASYKYATKLPKYADVNINMYGLEYNMQRLDYLYNPRSGFDVKVSGSAGTKKIKKNSELNEELYEGIDLNTSQYKLYGSMAGYIPVFSKSTIKLSDAAASIEAGNLFANELYRIGGNKTLRGFDEESITASFYNILTAEYRFLFEQNSYLFAFWNGAYYESRTVEKFTHDTPYGFGAGICFETKAGIFSLSYALGKQFDNPIYFKQAKIHFGIVSYF